MVRHVALFRWKPETTAEDVSKVEAALHRLPATIPCIKSYRFGRDLGVQDGNADFALVADFTDQDGFLVAAVVALLAAGTSIVRGSAGRAIESSKTVEQHAIG